MKYVSSFISLQRIQGLIRKEFILILRDKGTIAMLIIMPLMLLILFGFAIQMDPKDLPTAIISFDESPLVSDLVVNLQTSSYFKIVDVGNDVNVAEHALARGELSFIVHIPPHFTHDYVRAENPSLLIEMDGADPGSSGSALGHIHTIVNNAMKTFNQYGLGGVETFPHRNINIIVHRNFNESNKTQYNIVPGLIGVLLTMTMVMLTSTAITTERESGTMEMLLTTPLLPIEIILGKVIPYVILGYLQLTSVLFFGKLLINLPMEGELWLLYVSAAPFIVGNLMVGMIFSVIAKTPMQAIQLSIFYQLPSMFLSGYIFSFFGMPEWARAIGHCIPMTYFMRITRGILLKANTWSDVWPNILPIILISTLLVLLASKIFRKTLD